MSNWVKYAGATKFTVLLKFQRQMLSIEAEDDGRGFDINASQTSFGLNNIATRCKSLGGDMDVASSPTGTRITVSLPCVHA